MSNRTPRRLQGLPPDLGQGTPYKKDTAKKPTAPRKPSDIPPKRNNTEVPNVEPTNAGPPAEAASVAGKKRERTEEPSSGDEALTGGSIRPTQSSQNKGKTIDRNPKKTFARIDDSDIEIEDQDTSHLTNQQTNQTYRTEPNNPFLNQRPRPPSPLEWQTQHGRNRFKSGIPATLIPGKSTGAKILKLKEILKCPESLISVRNETYDGQEYITAKFGDNQTADTVTTISYSELNGNKLTRIHTPNRETQRRNAIRVWDIPLGTKQVEVRECFSKYGQIDGVYMNTQQMWQSATIYFTKKEDKDAILTNNWAITMGAESVRIHDAEHNMDQMKQKLQFAIKLTNLPQGTTAFDLKEICVNTGAKTCYIPRTLNEYKRKTFAVLAFESTSKAAEAMQTSPTLGEAELQWYPMEQKLCAICNQATHLAANCPTKAKRQQWQEYHHNQAQRFGNLYKRFQPARTAPIRAIATSIQTQKDKENRTYANIVKEHRNSNPMNNSEDTQTLLHTIIQEIREIKQKVDALEERIIWMEDNWDNNTQEKTTQSPTNQTDEMETESTPKPTGNPQAHTPAQATQSTIVSQVRSEQNAIHSSLEKLENAMHTMASSIGISINGHNTTNNHY
jgi:hypothetical protein